MLTFANDKMNIYSIAAALAGSERRSGDAGPSASAPLPGVDNRPRHGNLHFVMVLSIGPVDGRRGNAVRPVRDRPKPRLPPQL